MSEICNGCQERLKGTKCPECAKRYVKERDEAREERDTFKKIIIEIYDTIEVDEVVDWGDLECIPRTLWPKIFTPEFVKEIGCKYQKIGRIY